ncbi:MAG: DUF1501 domain-containing protein [Bacteroidota bacterium]
MKRRNFLRNTGTAVSLPIFLNGFPVSAIAGSPLFNSMNSDSDRVLVLIQLNGGNDGLNTLIPLDQYDNLYKHRSNVIIPSDNILDFTDTIGLHPNMTGIKSVYEEGQMGIVQSVGYPNQNRSHFRSTDIWTSASSSEEVITTGWIGRYLNSIHTEYPDAYPNDQYVDPLAITMGNVVSETCQGMTANFSLTLNDPFALGQLTESEGSELPDTYYGEELQFLRTTLAQTNAYSENITIAANKGNNTLEYPGGNRLAEQLKNVALLISGGLKTSIYVVSLGGFDTHADQVIENQPLLGDHGTLLQQLSDAVQAFQADLNQLGLSERVVTMTFSEFGRQIQSNFSLGTDHGTAAPLMLFGSCVNPVILGHNPEIGQEIERQEGVPMQYDFRDVYGSVLMDWFDVEEDAVKSLLYPEFTHIPILKDCSALTSSDWIDNIQPLELEVSPNPCSNWVQASFETEGEWVKLSVFNAFGSELKVVTSQKLSQGEHKIQIDMSQFPKGHYYLRLMRDSRQVTKRFIKV